MATGSPKKKRPLRARWAIEDDLKEVQKEVVRRLGSWNLGIMHIRLPTVIKRLQALEKKHEGKFQKIRVRTKNSYIFIEGATKETKTQMRRRVAAAKREMEEYNMMARDRKKWENYNAARDLAHEHPEEFLKLVRVAEQKLKAKADAE